MSALASKRITQKTFDECVRENVEEFEMEKEEALEDAVKQFTSQGVDLTNIDTSGRDREVQQRSVSEALELLKGAVTTREGPPDEAVCRQAMLDLAKACTNEAPNETEINEPLEGGGVRMEKNVTVNQSVIAMGKGPTCLAALLAHEPLCEAALDCVAAVCRHSVEARDAFPAQGMAVLAKILAVQAEQAGQAGAVRPGGVPAEEAGAAAAAPVVLSVEEVEEQGGGGAAGLGSFESLRRVAIKACKAVAVLTNRTENSKQGFVRKESGGLQALQACLTVFGEGSPALVVEAGKALKSVCTFDDLRKDFAGAFDASKAAVGHGVVPVLLRLVEVHEASSADAVAACFFALRAVAVNDDAVQQICAGGGLASAERNLTLNAGSAPVCRQASALLRNLSGNDGVKTSLCTDANLQLLNAAVAAHPTDPQVAEHVISTYAAMALRVPANCDRILRHGGHVVITKSLRRFPTVVPLQRQACLAVRNLVGRCPHLVEPLLEDGMEGLLRHAGTLTGSGCVEAAYAALRDLGLEVELLTVDAATGVVRKGVEQFGEAKSSFRAVWDDDPLKDAQRTAAMSAAAKSPAELGYKM